MAGHDETINDACITPRLLTKGLGSIHRFDVDDSGAKELAKLAQRDRLRNAVVMSEGVERLGDHQVRHDHRFTGDQRTFDAPPGELSLRARLTNQQPKHHGGIKPDGHRPIPERRFGGCRSRDATSLWRTDPREPTQDQSGPGALRTQTVSLPTSLRLTATLTPGARPSSLQSAAGSVAWRLAVDGDDMHAETVSRTALLRNVSGKAQYRCAQGHASLRATRRGSRRPPRRWCRSPIAHRPTRETGWRPRGRRAHRGVRAGCGTGSTRASPRRRSDRASGS